MSQEQYNQLMSAMLKERHALAKLGAELEGRKGKLCRCCKGFGHLARNCRNEGVEKREVIPQNKFEVLRSRIMQCGEGERMIRRMEVMEVECFKCWEKGHKCRECPLWIRKKNEERAARVIRPQKAQQKERRLRRAEEEVACPMKGKAQQEEWKRSSWEMLRKRAE